MLMQRLHVDERNFHETIMQCDRGNIVYLCGCEIMYNMVSIPPSDDRSRFGEPDIKFENSL
jgi:hypothetical protein